MSAIASGISEVVEDYDIEEAFSSLTLKDFSPQVYSVQTKFYSTSFLSIFVCLFNLSSSSSFLGVSIQDMNERLIEIGVCLVSFFLFILLMMRMREERDAFLQLDKHLAKIRKASLGELDKIEKGQKSALHQINASPLLDGSLLRRAEVAAENSKRAIQKLEHDLTKISANEYVAKRVGETKMTLTLTVQEVANSTADAVKALSSNIDKIEKLTERFELNANTFHMNQTSILERKGLSLRRKARIIGFGYVLPSITVALVLAAFFMPDHAQSLAALLKVSE